MSQNSQNLYGSTKLSLSPFRERLKRLKKMISTNVWLNVLPALENVERFNILLMLVEKRRMAFSQVLKERELTPGNCAYHLNKLMKAGLIDNSYQTPTEPSKEYSFYGPTDLGERVIEKLLSP